MQFRFVKTLDKDEIVAYSKERNELINSIEKMCNQNNNLIGYDNNRIKELNYLTIECFITCSDKIYALEGGKRYLIKKRLYELSEMFKNNFIYINQGCLDNINKIDYFDASIGGTLLIVFKSGYKDYVSRRQIKNIKERLGIKK